MKQYIDKSAVVAKIEKLSAYLDSFHEQRIIEKILSIIDTLEVKEIGIDFGDPKGDKSAKCIIDTKTLEVKDVDMEKEAELIANGIMISVQANKYNTVVYNTKRNDFNHSHLMLAARKGIELGLRTQKGE